MSEYLVYIGDSGWWAANGTVTSIATDAKIFTHIEAIAFCQRRYNKNFDSLQAVPVLLADVKEIKK